MATQMLVIDEDGSNLGVMDKKAALRMAEQKNLELVQVSCSSISPCMHTCSKCCFLDYLHDSRVGA